MLFKLDDPTTTLMSVEKAVAVTLRKTLLVSLENLLTKERRFSNPDVPRSGQSNDLLRNRPGHPHGPRTKGPKAKHTAFKDHESGYIHTDISYHLQLSDETGKQPSHHAQCDSRTLSSIFTILPSIQKSGKSHLSS